jgi:hypothetical protein
MAPVGPKNEPHQHTSHHTSVISHTMQGSYLTPCKGEGHRLTPHHPAPHTTLTPHTHRVRAQHQTRSNLSLILGNLQQRHLNTDLVERNRDVT